MNCQDVEKFIHAYLDGEFAEEERISLSAHLENCPHCSDVATFEQAFRERIRQGGEQSSAPAALKARLVAALDEQDEPSSFWSSLWVRRAVPATLMAATAVTALMIWQHSSEQAQVSDLAEASIVHHRRKVPFDVEGSHAERIRRYFSDKVPFVVHPLRVLGKRARLVGARLSHLRGHDAAYLVYQVDGRRVSVFVVEAGAVPPSTGTGNRFVGAHGYQVVMFRRGGTGYAVASDIDRQRLVRLIADHR